MNTKLSDLIQAYQKHIGASSPIVSPGASNDAFEVYTFSLILKAARKEGAQIKFKTINNTKMIKSLLFRSSPGYIYSKKHDYAYAEIQFSKTAIVEAHIGVYAMGGSGVKHECDVLVLNSLEAKYCRYNEVHPKKTSIITSAECKFYSKNVGLHLGREFLGLTLDIGKEHRFFISNTDGKSLDKVLVKHHRQRYLGLTPLKKDNEKQVIGLFRTAFRDYLAKNR